MKINMHAVLTVIMITVLAGFGMARVAVAASAGEIDTKVNGTLEEFKKTVPGGAEFLDFFLFFLFLDLFT